MPRSSRRPFTVNQKADLYVREVKRRLIAAGRVEDPATARPKFDWHWGVPEGEGWSAGGVVEANTQSEAKARIKKAMGVKTLPKNLEIVKVDPLNATARAVAESIAVGPASA